MPRYFIVFPDFYNRNIGLLEQEIILHTGYLTPIVHSKKPRLSMFSHITLIIQSWHLSLCITVSIK